MTRVLLALVFTVCSLIITASNAETVEVQASLVTFMAQLNTGSNPVNLTGWNMSLDPCLWEGVVCTATASIFGIKLDSYSFTGTLDAASLCVANSIQFLVFDNNNISGPLPEEISKCGNLSYLAINNNFFTGVLPDSLSQLYNLQGLVVSANNFSGELPRGMTILPDLAAFYAQDNMFAGSIPNFNFDNFYNFNVSNNLLSGEIPVGGSRFGASSFSGNQGLCGDPLPNSCASAPAPAPSQG